MRRGGLRAHRVSHWFEPRAPVLDVVDLVAAAGEIVLLSGANGVGKTTLVRILAGVLRPRSGTCERDGRVGYLPQRGDEPPPRITAEGWLSAVRRMGGRRSAITDTPELLATLGVPSTGLRLDRASRGTVAKVMLVSALADRPDVVLLDEPFASLDGASRVAAADLVHRAARDGAAVVVSGHAGTSALTPTRAVRLLEGRLHQAATDTDPDRRWRIVLRGDGGGRQLTVGAGERDRVLLDALRRGEQVLLVEPI